MPNLKQESYGYQLNSFELNLTRNGIQVGSESLIFFRSSYSLIRSAKRSLKGFSYLQLTIQHVHSSSSDASSSYALFMEYSNAGMMRRTAVDMSVHSHDDSIALTQVIRGRDLQANPIDGRRGVYLTWNLLAKVEDLHNEQLAWYTMYNCTS